MYIGQNKWNLWLGGSGEHVTLPPLLFTWKILAIPTLSRIQTLTGHKTVCGFQCFKKFSHYLSQPFHKKSSTQSKRPPPQEMEWKMFEKMTTLTFSINFCTFSLVTRAFKPLFCLAPWWKNINKNHQKSGWMMLVKRKKSWKNAFAFPWHGMWVSGVFGKHLPTRTAGGQLSRPS